MGALAAVAFVLVGGLSIVLSVIDIRTHRLPDRLVLPGIVVTALVLTAQAVVGGETDRLIRSLLAAAVCAAVLFVLAFLHPAGLGLGDVKLVAMLGLPLGWLGWSSVLTGLLAAFVLNGALVLVLLLARRTGRGGEVPFGPSLVLGAALAVLLALG